MKKSLLCSCLMLIVLFFSQCSKEIDEPKQEADGKNLIYLKIDDSEEFLLDSRSKFFHKNTASNIEAKDNIRYSEFNRNNRTLSDFSIAAIPLKYKESNFSEATIRLRFDKETQKIDTAYLNNNLMKTWSTAISFIVNSDGYKEYFIDSIIDYNVIKWDVEKKILTFSANCTYSISPGITPPNPHIYFYLDINY